jgi:tRNA dimethylallyltransferase
VLAERIERRLEARLEKGMIEEVAALRARGVTDERLERFGLEYRYISRLLRGEIPTLEKLREQLATAIRQFAKEQVTWFKRDKRIVWLDPFSDYFLEACKQIEEWDTRG